MTGKQWNKEKLRMLNILIEIPDIRQIIKDGYKWDRLKIICEPLGLCDTSFRDYPNIKDYLLDPSYWLEKLRLNYLKKKKYF
jgi:hypothetical protein